LELFFKLLSFYNINGDPSVAHLPPKDGGGSLVFGGKYVPPGSL